MQFVSERKQIALMADEKSPARISHRLLAINRSEVRINMHIILNNSSMIPIYEQLMEQIKNEIISGGLKEGEALPSVRTLSGELKISALTVKKAYDKLEEENFVSTVHGKGTFVTATDMELAAEARRHAVEEDFCHAVAKARTVGMSDEEIKELFAIIIEE